MNPSPNREVIIFSAALELPPSQRSAYLDKACADDPALRLRVGSLLRVHEEAITFLENKAAGAQESPMGAEVPGATIRITSAPSEKAGDHIRSKSSSWGWIPARSSPASRRSGRRWP